LRTAHVGGLLALTLTLSGFPVEAQTLRGTVRDSDTGEPVQLAYVGLLAEGRELVVAALADTGGAFELEAPISGSYFVYVSRTGYETVMDGLFELGVDGVMDVRIGLTPAPVELEPVEVEAGRHVTPLEASGFFDRALTAQGHFLIREDLERASVSRVSDAFRGLSRVEVDASRPLTGPNAMQSPAIVMRRGVDRCNPTLYIDRSVVATGVLDAVRPDDYVSPSEVEAVEIYTRATQVPVDFDAINDCGVVLIWTRAR